MLRIPSIPAGEPIAAGGDPLGGVPNPSLSQKTPVFTDYQVTLNGQTAALHAARVSAMSYNTVWPGFQRPIDQTEIAPFLSFEADEPVEVCVMLDRAPAEAVVRPLSEGIVPMIDGRTVRFTLTRPGQYTLEADGYHRALHIFSNPVRDWNVDPDDPNVLYYGPGVHKVGGVLLHSGQTVYIDREAIVYGAFAALGQHDVRICGYGILDGSWEHRVTGHSFYLTCRDRVLHEQDEAGLLAFLYRQNTLWGNIRFLNCENVTLEGVTLRDSASFSVIPGGCRGVLIDNVKTIGMWRYNSDGIDLINSADCVVRHCFLRDFDDCMVIKGTMGFDALCNENILVEDCVIWCDWGRALEIGAETCAPEYRNIVFRDCDVIHGAHVNLDLQHHNHAVLHDILFDDIRIEYSKYQRPSVYQHDMTAPYDPPAESGHPVPFGIFICNSGLFCEDYRNGSVHDVTFRGIRILSDPGIAVPGPVFRGLDDAHDIRDIRIENLTVNGKKAETPEEAHVKANEFVRNLRIG